MEELLEGLKMLEYEKNFLQQQGLKPLSHSYFAIPFNANEQFHYFKLYFPVINLSLVSWLFELNGSNVGDYASYDDPISVASNIQFELKKMGIECDFPPLKLKTGAGEFVIVVLQKLVNKTLKQRQIKFKAPRIKKEEVQEEEMADEEDLNPEEGIMEENIEGGSDDELSEDFGMDTKAEDIYDEDKFTREIMYTRIEEKDWKIEC